MTTAADRRKLLIERMDALQAQGIDCSSCTGQCCTSRCNSMLISETEAQDIRAYLFENNLWSPEMKLRLEQNVSEYRLDVDLPAHGSRRNLRRTYTCPFYNAGPRGCLLPREVKPYGCLGFNAVTAGATGLESGCQSDQALLAQQSEQATHKLPIPVAVLQACI